MKYTDKQRIDFLESCRMRTRYVNVRLGNKDVDTDLHISKFGTSIYLRDIFGNIENEGHGKTVRSAIDDVMKQFKVKTVEG